MRENLLYNINNTKIWVKIRLFKENLYSPQLWCLSITSSTGTPQESGCRMKIRLKYTIGNPDTMLYSNQLLHFHYFDLIYGEKHVIAAKNNFWMHWDIKFGYKSIPTDLLNKIKKKKMKKHKQWDLILSVCIQTFSRPLKNVSDVG